MFTIRFMNLSSSLSGWLAAAVANAEATHGRKMDLGTVPVFHAAQRMTTGLIQQFDSVLLGMRYVVSRLTFLFKGVRAQNTSKSS